MAQQVGYFDDDVAFTEGPFVIVDIWGWRIEVELKDYHCSVLPDLSLTGILRDLGYNGKTRDREHVASVCDRRHRRREGAFVVQGAQRDDNRRGCARPRGDSPWIRGSGSCW